MRQTKVITACRHYITCGQLSDRQCGQKDENMFCALNTVFYSRSGFPQCKDFSLQEAKLCGEGVNINSIYHAIFSQVHCPSLLYNPTPMWAALCKLLVEALQRVFLPTSNAITTGVVTPPPCCLLLFVKVW